MTFAEILKANPDFAHDLDAHLARLLLSGRAGGIGIEINCSRGTTEVKARVVSPSTSHELNVLFCDTHLTPRS